ncbi:FecR family protein [Dyadobacter sandarakinus]|uniref:FecR domain-containing protein n=1 Tax=Dyadobacter sandarakinus TaxID=2747268 RepID=A0ABX7I416_9BACT|nr:FecR family protein [Dyadobacter sandarakinus]QRR00535.1 FecR domain-containing protein [Dyadobacter sandarakinus]
MNHFHINELISKYVNGTTNADEDALVEQYLENNPMPENHDLIAEKDEIGARISRKLYRNTIRKPLSVWWRNAGIAAAACLALTAGLGWYFGSGNAGYGTVLTALLPDQPEGVEVKNTSRKPQRLTLDDGSEVTLQPGSRISYPERFGLKKRVVSLHGEAFFKVKKDPSKPFVVATENLATQVLGTSFNVRSYDRSGSIEVQVATGRVSVYEVSGRSNAKRNGVILTPNQRIVFDKRSQKMELGIVKNPIVVRPLASRQHFEFTESPVINALDMLEKTYGISIVVEGNMLRNCLFTGDLNNLPMFDQLSLICRSVNVDYEQRGTTIFIDGEGCPGNM